MGGPVDDARRERGLLIAKQEGGIRRVWDGLYYVRSQSGQGEYEVAQTQRGWACSCPDFSHRNIRCKHVYAVEISLRMRKTVDGSRVISEISVSDCYFCNSQRLKKSGVRHNRSGDIQRFACLDCHRTFSVNVGFERMKHNPKAITTALQLYFSGESLRNTQKPLTLITDGGSHFRSPFRKEFRTADRLAKHVRDIALKGRIHNNRMERMNGELRDREKVMRGVKRTDSPIFAGLQIYHNFVRPHEALNGQTPAEACGIKVEGADKWRTLIQNASRQNS